jgi:hypothetical protein
MFKIMLSSVYLHFQIFMSLALKSLMTIKYVRQCSTNHCSLSIIVIYLQENNFILKTNCICLMEDFLNSFLVLVFPLQKCWRLSTQFSSTKRKACWQRCSRPVALDKVFGEIVKKETKKEKKKKEKKAWAKK